MDYSSTWIDTSLDLNFNPSVLQDDKKPVPGKLQTNVFDLGWKPSVKEETAGELAEELKRVNEENKKLTEMLTVLCENYNALRNHLTDYMIRNPEKELTSSKKRKSESSHNNRNNGIVGISESSSTNEDSSSKKLRDETIKAKVSRVYVRTEASDTTLVVKDGYQWRKYGQKVTRDNPSPRAYFKCSFAPSCPVKKKVQRSVEDQSVLVATYEGEHNHAHPSQLEVPSGSNPGMTLGSVPCSTSLGTSGPTITLDLTRPEANVGAKSSSTQKMNKPELQHFLVEQMASSLTNDPNFTAALAAAISGKMFHQNPTGKW